MREVLSTTAYAKTTTTTTKTQEVRLFKLSKERGKKNVLEILRMYSHGPCNWGPDGVTAFTTLTVEKVTPSTLR